MKTQEHKIVNAIVFFVQNTKKCHKTKLFKLLYFLDFIHFKRYGFTVTGFSYKAFPKGPVPVELLEMMGNEKYPQLFVENIKIIKEECDSDDNSYFFRIIPKKDKPDLDWFSPSELKVMKEVAEIYQEASANLIIEASHLHNSPWDKTIKNTGMYSPIDILLALDDETTLSPEDIAERLEMKKLLD